MSHRCDKELILASKAYTPEDRVKSWSETLITLFAIISLLTVTLLDIHIALRVGASIVCGLFYVRMFVIYHDYQHHAILQKSKTATLIMRTVGIYLLAPENVWKRSHDHHHNHNSKLTMSGIGSYPTVSKTTFLKLTDNEKRLYLINRHPLTVIFGYFTLFVYWLNVKSFVQSPAKHMDSLVALAFHVIAGTLVWSFLGTTTFFIAWFIPYFIAFGMGSYLFYCQHNFPGAQFKEQKEWKYAYAALSSTSYMEMNPVMQWMTGNIGYHHVHHLNSRIPFYRLPEAMKEMPELHHVTRTSWNPVEMWRCFRLKLWDGENGEMITMSQFKKEMR